MTVTGQQIREEMIQRGLILHLGAAGASAATTYIDDTLRRTGDNLPSSGYAGCWIRWSAGTNHDGKTTVIAPARELKTSAVNQLDARIMASPAVAGSAIFMRTETHLYRIEK